MTEIEATTFVTEEIVPRCFKAPNTVQFGDWVAVAMTAELTRARAAAKELARDATAKFTVKAFAALLTDRMPGRRAPVSEHPHYDPYIRCLEAPVGHPGWEDREWFTTEGFARANAGDKRYVTEYAEAMAARVQEREGGRWCGIVREPRNQVPSVRDPEGYERIRADILDGPDTPGHRFLLRIGEPWSLKAAVAESLRPDDSEPWERG